MQYFLTHWRRFLFYSIFGTTAFLFDLALLYTFREIVAIPYWVAVPLAFVIATSLHYVLVRLFVFHDTTRSVHEGYFIFLLILCSNALLVTVLVVLLVEYAGVMLYLARTSVAGLVGILSFFFNSRYNFRIT